MMRANVENVCDLHPDRFECPDALVNYGRSERESESGNHYGLIIHDGGSSSISIAFCPWCGTRLPG
jgi:hypothetical protein